MDWAFTQPSTVTPRFLPYLAYRAYHSIVHCPVVGKTTLLRQKYQQIHYKYYRIATKLSKAYQYLLW